MRFIAARTQWVMKFLRLWAIQEKQQQVDEWLSQRLAFLGIIEALLKAPLEPREPSQQNHIEGFQGDASLDPYYDERRLSLGQQMQVFPDRLLADGQPREREGGLKKKLR